MRPGKRKQKRGKRIKWANKDMSNKDMDLMLRPGIDQDAAARADDARELAERGEAARARREVVEHSNGQCGVKDARPQRNVGRVAHAHTAAVRCSAGGDLGEGG